MKKDKAVRKAEFKAALIKQLKSMIGPAILLLIIVAGVLFIMFYKEEEEPEEIIKVNTYEGGEEMLTMENDKLVFAMDPLTTQFTVTMKETGTVWYSNPPEASSDPLAMANEKNKLQSTVLLTYSTINGVDTLQNNYAFSIEKGVYELEQGADYIKVKYSIGDVEKEYTIPPVISEERMTALLDKMDKGDRNYIGNFYKKYDINNMKKRDDPEALLARYPILADTVIYALSDKAEDNHKSKMEPCFLEAGYTYEDYLADRENDLGESGTDKPVFNMTMTYRLDGDDLVVEVPYSDLEYKEDNPIYYLSLLPYFGAAGTQDEGFLLVPEGGGALINYNNGKTAQSFYYANMYGWDMAQDRDALVHETRTYFNVFGAATGDASYICVIEEGAPYAAIQADISGRGNSYNYVNAVYTVDHREQYDVSDRYNGSMFVYEPDIPRDEKLVQRYCFVNSGSYADMAGAYRDYLTGKYGSYLTENDDAQTPVAVELLGAVDKIKQVAGIPVSRPLELTTYREAQGILEDLTASGVGNISVKLSGWMNGGVQQKILNKVRLVGDLGSRKDLKALTDYASSQGMDFYLDGVTNYAYDSNILNGFNVFTDAARFISKEKAELFEYNTVSYVKRESKDSFYLLSASQIDQMIGNLADYAGKMGVGISFQDIGKDLSSDYTRDAVQTRQKSLQVQARELKELKDSGMKVMVNMGNDYAMPYADLITNMDLAGSGYTIIDREIPFYQMAIHGLVNYTGEPLNLTQNFQQELLNSAEYGAGLSFTLMEDSAFTLQNTLYTQYFGAEYAAWKNRLLEIYSRYNTELGGVFRQRMTGHEYLNEKLTCTVYEDGTRVYVNYSFDDMETEDGVTVPARDYRVVR